MGRTASCKIKANPLIKSLIIIHSNDPRVIRPIQLDSDYKSQPNNYIRPLEIRVRVSNGFIAF